MWRSASTSERRRRAGFAVLSACALGLASPPAAAAVLVDVDEALAAALPAASSFERKTAFLDAAQSARVERDAGTAPPSRIVTYYVARSADREGARPVGYAYLDTHLVRTLQETLLVVLDAGGSVRRVEVVAFFEPREYLPSRRWLAQYAGRGLDDELGLKRGIRMLSGATLSSRAATDAVRRVLAIHAELVAPGPPR